MLPVCLNALFIISYAARDPPRSLPEVQQEVRDMLDQLPQHRQLADK